ncbi:dihydroorotase [Corynebacterium sp.]|uniref:dihydroorotase n=1 Tax=Corynebacterium sp. TaxID=1720 RepID=UPI0026DD24B8|nr:dihydroorotase [Corynebacterium sp.]MDO4609432.1 dihydroorotase [Corynebacterium sp.]
MTQSQTTPEPGVGYPDTGPLAPPARGDLLLRGVRPYGEGDPVDVLVRDGVIEAIGPDAGRDAADGATTLEFDGLVLLPGLVDIHVHLREPGREDTETLATGSAAAARGGFTAVFTMPNTKPVMDDPSIAESVWLKAQAIGLCDVHPIGSITKGLEGTSLTEFGMMADSQAKVRVFSDDGKCVDDPLIMRRAIEYARGMDVLLAQHCEDPRLTVGAVAHEGPTAARLGLGGWPRVAEESIVARDAILARDYGGRTHICHASTEGTVELVKWAKDHGIPMTAEVTPHHLILTDARLETFDGVNRVNPPLREDRDTKALRQALIDGVIDCVATDHAPHGSEEKCCEFDMARPGMLGLETSMSIIAEEFVLDDGPCDWRWLAKVMSERPAEIVRLPGHGRPIAVGEPANLTVVDPDKRWIVHGEDLASKTTNTPYEDMEMRVSVAATVLRGRVTALHGEADPVLPDDSGVRA